MKRVGIFDADAPGALAFVRSLGRAGVPTRVYATGRLSVAGLSRYCSARGRCPDPADAAGFVPFLRRELEAGRIDLVAPTSDLIAYCAAEVGASFPAREAVQASLFKDRFDAACARLGFETPWSAAPRSVAEAHAEAGRYRYPALLKPKSHVGVGLFERGALVQDADELRRVFAEYPLPAGYEHLPELALPMVQEYVPAALANLYSVSGVLAANGACVAASVSRKAGQWPPALGVGIEFHAVRDEALLARGVALARGVLGRGIFEVEFIRDERTGAWVAIDLNPRAHGFISFDIARGHDLPLLWYRLATGDTVAPVSPARDDLTWVHGIPWHTRRLVRAVRGADLTPPPRGAIDIMHDPADPLPSVRFAAVMLRHPGGLIRPFWSEPSISGTHTEIAAEFR